MKLCGTCIEKEKISEKGNIWDFNPFIDSYQTYQDIKNGFDLFYKTQPPLFYMSHNEEGYTYSQWYVYFLSKNYYKYKKLKKNTLWLFQAMSCYSFFPNLIRLGSKEDALHTTLHHFLKYLETRTFLNGKMMELLLTFGLSLHDEDNQGMTGFNYLHQELLSEEDRNRSYELTNQYKTLEKMIDPVIMESLKEKILVCERCNEYLQKYQDMIDNKEILASCLANYLDSIYEIIRKRQECIDIYRKYVTYDEKSTERHQYVVDIYQKIFKQSS